MISRGRAIQVSATILLCLSEAAWAQPAQSQPDDSCKTRLMDAVKEIGRSGSADAEDKLIAAWVAPLADALAQFEKAPREERLRVTLAMRRVTAHLRLRLFRAQLEPADQARLDRVLAKDRPLLEALFHDDDRVRLEALDRIPMEPNTVAGLLVVAKLNDDSAEVIDRALAKARALHDSSVLRGLRRFMREVLDELPHATQKLDEVEIAIVLCTFLENAAVVLAENGSQEDAVLIAEALERLSEPALRQFLQSLNPILDGLGRIGDERIALTLLAFLSDETLQTLTRLPDGTAVFRSTGDAAMLALARIYGISPDSLGFVSADPKDVAMGFTDGDRRARAHLAFRKWFDENAKLPRASRATLPPISVEGGR